MTAKIVKIILLTSLIAMVVFIPPTSTSNTFADTTDPRLDKIEELKERYEGLRDNTRSTDKYQKYSDIIERLNLAERWIILENRGESTSAEANEILEELLEHMPEGGNSMSSTTLDRIQRGYNSYQTSSQTRDNCDTQCIHTIESPTGTVGGICKMFGQGAIVLVTSNAYYGTVFALPNGAAIVLI